MPFQRCKRHRTCAVERLRLMRKTNINNRLSVDALRSTGFEFGQTDLTASIGATIAWYRANRWIIDG